MDVTVMQAAQLNYSPYVSEWLLFCRLGKVLPARGRNHAGEAFDANPKSGDCPDKLLAHNAGASALVYVHQLRLVDLTRIASRALKQRTMGCTEVNRLLGSHSI